MKGASGFLIIVTFWLLGEHLAPWLPLDLPGSVLGMLLLFVGLRSGLLPRASVDETGAVLLRHMGLFFLPVSAAVVYETSLIGEDFWPFVAATGAGFLLLFTLAGRLARRALGSRP